ncbi:MAG: outer membrane protein assembly factor [Bacteroidales bacterium]|jgi:outer membrane protein assembly factor BamA|nr:outer membrane protein assembly factor [Bacteroidales bacterium]
MKTKLYIIFLISSAFAIQAQDTNDIIKKGISFGPLPIVAFDADKGLQYGGLLNIFDFGDGSYYPVPKQQWYIEAAGYSKGSQQYFLTYDAKNLIPNIRMSLAATIMLDQAMDFYGYNGYQANYYADSVSAFYRLGRKNISLKADFVGKLPMKNWYWQGSYYFGWYDYSVLDKNKINKGKPESEQFWDETLYEKYIKWGIIPNNEIGGGRTSALRGGLMYDTRDFEPAPSSGIWAETNITLAPKSLGSTNAYNRYMFIFRHYVSMAKKSLTFAYRLNYQGSIGSYVPYYILPVFSTIGREYDRDGLGGYRTVRGIMRDRVQGLDEAFFNAEWRWKFVSFKAANQNVYLGLNAFFDGGIVIRNYKYDLGLYCGNGETLDWQDHINLNQKDKLHTAAGAGFRIVINQNFIIAVDYAKPLNKQDGNGSLYVNTGYLF